MTRINVVPVEELNNLHLLAEYRELPRVFKLAENYYKSGKFEKTKEIPEKYTLGKGHVKFFYNKLLYLINRQELIIKEMKKRGYNPHYNNVSALIEKLPNELLGDFFPEEEDLKINRERIALRLKEYEYKKNLKKNKL